MRIATWNVNGLRARLAYIQHWLAARAPDVVGLQELKVAEDKFPTEVFEQLGYQVALHAQKSWNGVAVLSRLPMRVRQRGLPGEAAGGARLLHCRIAAGALGELDFATVYCPNGKHIEHPDFARKLVWYESLTAYLGGLGDVDGPKAQRGFVVCGDFNVVPEAVDGWRGAAADGSIFCTQEERDRYRALLGLGLEDLFRVRHPSEQAFSWWDYRAGAFPRNQGLRIDTLLGNAAVREQVREVVIDRDYRKKKDGNIASDHAPVYADLA